jgi:hypothetical protein
MPAPLVVSIPHSLGQAEAERRLKSGLERLTGTEPLLRIEQQTWVNSRMTFVVRALGQSVPGTLDVGANTVRLEIDLPLILRKLWAPLEKALVGRARLLLEKK